MTTSFSCRSRTIQVSTAEAALALNGTIAQSLRQRSSVFYWQHSAQERSLREAVCTKNRGWHLRSFGSHGRWAQAARERCLDVQHWQELSSCKAFAMEDLKAEWRRAHGVNSSVRGAGWWRWKPYYLLQELRTLPMDDVLVHADYDLVLKGRPAALFCIGQKCAYEHECRPHAMPTPPHRHATAYASFTVNLRSGSAPIGVAAFHMPCLTDRAWTKREAAAAFHASDSMLDTAQLYAGLVILRRTEFTERFLSDWLELTTRGELATDSLGSAQDAHFIAHRHDQSLLSLLAKQRGIKSYPLPTAGHDVHAMHCDTDQLCEMHSLSLVPHTLPLAVPLAFSLSATSSHAHSTRTGSRHLELGNGSLSSYLPLAVAKLPPFSAHQGLPQRRVRASAIYIHPDLHPQTNLRSRTRISHACTYITVTSPTPPLLRTTSAGISRTTRRWATSATRWSTARPKSLTMAWCHWQTTCSRMQSCARWRQRGTSKRRSCRHSAHRGRAG